MEADGRQRTFVWDIYHREVALPQECEKMWSTLGNCMLNAVASVAPESDIKELTSFYEENQVTLTANDFTQMFSSQRQELPCQLQPCESASFLFSNPRQAFLCHEGTLCGSGQLVVFLQGRGCEDHHLRLLGWPALLHFAACNVPSRNCAGCQPHLLCAQDAAAHRRFAVLSCLSSTGELCTSTK